jgi:DNA gyrase subunit A
MGRATQGVTLIGLDEGSQLSGLQRIVENDANQPESAEDGTEDGAENDAAPATDLPADDSSDA